MALIERQLFFCHAKRPPKRDLCLRCRCRDRYLCSHVPSGGADIFDKTELSNDLPLPLYLQLARHLRSLVSGGASLPAKDVLFRGSGGSPSGWGFRASPSAKRCAELSAEGLLQQRQEAGTFVNRGLASSEQRLRTLSSFSEDVASRGLKPGSVWLHRKVAVGDTGGNLALCLRPGSTSRSARQAAHRAQAALMALETAVVPTRFCPIRSEVKEFSLRDAAPPRLYAVPRTSAAHRRSPDPELAKQLDVPEKAPPRSPSSAARCWKDDTLLELVHSHYRGDAYDFRGGAQSGGTGRTHEASR